MSLGGTYAAPAELVFLQDTDSGQVVLAAASGAAAWWPFVIVLLILSGIITFILVELWLKKRRAHEAQFSSDIPLAVVARDADARAVEKSHDSAPTSKRQLDQKDMKDPKGYHEHDQAK